LIKILNS